MPPPAREITRRWISLVPSKSQEILGVAVPLLHSEVVLVASVVEEPRNQDQHGCDCHG
jgi:hypothetical protein